MFTIACPATSESPVGNAQTVGVQSNKPVASNLRRLEERLLCPLAISDIAIHTLKASLQMLS